MSSSTSSSYHPSKIPKLKPPLAPPFPSPPARTAKIKIKSTIPSCRVDSKRKQGKVILVNGNDTFVISPGKLKPLTPTHSSEVLLADPLSRINSDDVSFVDRPINVEKERKDFHSAMLGLIPPVRSTDSMERMQKRLENFENFSYNQQVAPIIKEVLHKLAAATEDQLLDDVKPPVFAECSESLEDVDSNNNLLEDYRHERDRVKRVVENRSKPEFDTKLLYKRDSGRRRETQDKDYHFEDLVKSVPKSAKAKTIFSLGSPLKIVTGPGENGDSHSKTCLPPIVPTFPSQSKVREPQPQLLQEDEQKDADFLEALSDVTASIRAICDSDSESKEGTGKSELEPELETDDGEGKVEEDLFQEIDGEEELPPCMASLSKNSTLIMLRDGDSVYHSHNCEERSRYRATLEMRNTTDELYGYKIQCTSSALEHFNVNSKIGLIPPDSSISLKFKSKKSVNLTAEAVTSDKFTIKYFPVWESPAEAYLDEIFQQLLMESPELIMTEMIENVVLWDAGDLLRVDEMLTSVKSKVERIQLASKKSLLYQQYQDYILPQVNSKRKFNSIRNRMLMANQRLKDYLRSSIRMNNAIHIFSFLCLYVVTFVALFPFLTTDVVVKDKSEGAEDSWFYKPIYAIKNLYGSITGYFF